MPDVSHLPGPFNGGILTGSCLGFGIAAFIVVSIRIWFRVWKRTIGISDYCIIISVITSIVQCAVLSSSVTQWGYGHHDRDIPAAIRSAPTAALLFWINQLFFKLTTLFSKLSFFFVYQGLFAKNSTMLVRVLRVVNYFTAFLVTTYYFSAFWVSLFQCIPVQKAWKSKTPGHCIENDTFRIVTHAVNVTTSILLITMPLPVLFSIKKRSPEITGFIILILLGLSHTSCTIIRLILQLHPLAGTKTDPHWVNVINNAIGVIEMEVGIIAASLVLMRPFFSFLRELMFGPKISSTNPSGYANMDSSLRRTRDGTQRDIKITKTVDIEMDSRDRSTENILATNKGGSQEAWNVREPGEK
ncbi:hypothetical protein F5884DRAFT_417189 [Xylogone sp. PMI_703]|nr:hypothetical protein F5884DRAFT_417189 [Xylogone sp. PMI_703]